MPPLTALPRRDIPGAGLLSPGGSEPLLSRERIDRIVTAVRSGAYLGEAAAFAGVTPRSFQAWRRRGGEVAEYIESLGLSYAVDEDLVESAADGRRRRMRVHLEALPGQTPAVDPRKAEIEYFDELCLVLHAEVMKAQHDAELRMVAQWSKAAEHDWRAAAAFLARRFPGRWGERVAATGPGGGAVEVDARRSLAHEIANDPEARRLASEHVGTITTTSDTLPALGGGRHGPLRRTGARRAGPVSAGASWDAAAVRW